ncbi:hypothetical protein FHW84_002496 [Dyella sp. SG562]|uniref:DUF7940 domain-containing protein n=1 Tax=Dyella sp. SG562 TaxID=2587017 RepID=UPI001422367A|nr:hypothetical protein [Dyella sp. SG562]NII73923.1 hypothetical protein [Dyella sp. SG562]
MSLRDHLVDDWQEWKRWWSMRWILVSAALGAAQQAWPMLPSEWIAAFPHWVRLALGIGSLSTVMAAGAARIVRQKKPDEIA